MQYSYTYFITLEDGSNEIIATCSGPVPDNISVGESMLYRHENRFYSYKILNIWNYKRQGQVGVVEIYISLDRGVEYNRSYFPGIF